MRGAVAHHAVIRAEVNGQIEVDRRRGKITVEVVQPVPAHVERRLLVIYRVHRALMMKNRGVVLLAVAVEPVEVVLKADCVAVGANTLGVDRVALLVDLALFKRFLEAFGGDSKLLRSLGIVLLYDMVERLGILLNHIVRALLTDEIRDSREQQKAYPRQKYDDRNYGQDFSPHHLSPPLFLRLLPRLTARTTAAATTRRNTPIPMIIVT